MAKSLDQIIQEINLASPDSVRKNEIDIALATLNSILTNEALRSLNYLEINRLFMYLTFKASFCIPLLEKLIEIGADSNYGEQDQEYLNITLPIYDPQAYKLSSGMTPLMCAAFQGHPKVVEFLISKNVNVNAATKNGMTALLYAASVGSNVVKLLLDAKADPNAKSFDSKELIEGVDLNGEERGKTALMLALQLNYKRKTWRIYLPHEWRNPRSRNKPFLIPEHTWHVVNDLLDAGAQLETRDYRGHTAFKIAMQSFLSPSMSIYPSYSFIFMIVNDMLCHGPNLHQIGLEDTNFGEFWNKVSTSPRRKGSWMERDRRFLENLIQEVLVVAQGLYFLKKQELIKEEDPWIKDEALFKQCVQELLGPDCSELLVRCSEVLKQLMSKKNDIGIAATPAQVQGNTLDVKIDIEMTTSSPETAPSQNNQANTQLVASSSGAVNRSSLGFMLNILQSPYRVARSIVTSVGNFVLDRESEEEQKRAEELNREYEVRREQEIRQKQQNQLDMVKKAFIGPHYYAVMDRQFGKQKKLPIVSLTLITQFLQCSRAPAHHNALYALHFNRFRTVGKLLESGKTLDKGDSKETDQDKSQANKRRAVEHRSC